MADASEQRADDLETTPNPLPGPGSLPLVYGPLLPPPPPPLVYVPMVFGVWLPPHVAADMGPQTLPPYGPGPFDPHPFAPQAAGPLGPLPYVSLYAPAPMITRPLSPPTIIHPIRIPDPLGFNPFQKLSCFFLNHLQLPLKPSREPYPNFFTPDQHRWIYSMRIPRNSPEIQLVELDTAFAELREIHLDIITYRVDNVTYVTYEIEVFATCVDAQQAVICHRSLISGIKPLELKMVVQWEVNKRRLESMQLLARMDTMAFEEVLKVLRYASKWKIGGSGESRLPVDAERMRGALESVWPVDDRLWMWMNVGLSKIRG